MDGFLSIKDLRKEYGETIALANVNMEVSKGSIHAIIGENGAGKSTLIKILSGLVIPTKGTIRIDNKEFYSQSIMKSREFGISTAFQELSLLPNLTVAQNLSLPSLKSNKFKLTNQKVITEDARRILHEYGLDHISPNQEVGSLALAEKQKLEIAKAFSKKPKLLLLDEPTAALPEPEWLFEILERPENNEITVLYISHRLNEIRRICDSATILRNGRTIQSVALDQVNNDDVFKMMVGDSKHNHFSKRTVIKNNNEQIKVEQLTGKKIKDVSFSIESGEILGIAGLEGQGQDELFKILAGVKNQKSGSIMVNGKKVKLSSPQQALKQGIGYIPEERKTEGILQGMSTMNNITLSKLNKVSRFGFLRNKKEMNVCKGEIEKVQLEERYLSMPIDSLSGGNQQKAIMLRVLLTDVPNLLLYDPTRGVDVATKQTFYDVIQKYAEEGGSVLWYSTDLYELISVCDRILVFYEGQIVMNCLRENADVETLITAATGNAETEVLQT